jgi:class 3 adenylate cyclase
VELPGADGPLPWEHPELALDAIEEFLTGKLGRADATRAVTTLLFTDIVRSTEWAGAVGDERWREFLTLHDDAARRTTAAFGGASSRPPVTASSRRSMVPGARSAPAQRFGASYVGSDSRFGAGSTPERLRNGMTM